MAKIVQVRLLLKALYSVLRSHEESNRGNSNQDFSEVLSDKLYWTFQTEKIGEVSSQKGDGKKLSTTITLEDKLAIFQFWQRYQCKSS